MSTTSLQTVTLHIIIEKPVAGILYGLQKGSGAVYETVQKQLSDGSDLYFELTLVLKRDKEGALALSGPFVQGPPKERFLYIDMGSYAGQADMVHNGRLKVPLPQLTEASLKELEKGAHLTTKIPGTKGKDGSPNMGTVKPFSGWQAVANPSK